MAAGAWGGWPSEASHLGAGGTSRVTARNSGRPKEESGSPASRRRGVGKLSPGRTSRRPTVAASHPDEWFLLTLRPSAVRHSRLSGIILAAIL